ncbi:MAG: sensor histidine kinase [Bacteroidetes bacterium]|nr:sensor histidine kinase [Bacteroidota bacterium]
MVVVGILVSILLKIVIYDEPSGHPIWYDFVASIIITIVVWEGNLIIDDQMNRKYPWVDKTKLRLLIHPLLAILYSSISLYLLMLLFNTYVCGLDTHHRELMKGSLLIGLLVTVIILSFEIGGQLLQGWKRSLLEVEKYRTESISAQLQNLKNQINPHFLFNNLSVLSSLVYDDADKAVDFINQLSKVYRYVLEQKDTELVQLENEIRFIESYIFLLKIRFDKNIEFHLDIDPSSKEKFLPPMSLQMLCENAIKHNEISHDHPLHIHLYSEGNKLVVSNVIRDRKQAEPSSNTGLKNIMDRYRFFTEESVDILREGEKFIVRIPLLKFV